MPATSTSTTSTTTTTATTGSNNNDDQHDHDPNENEVEVVVAAVPPSTTAAAAPPPSNDSNDHDDNDSTGTIVIDDDENTSTRAGAPSGAGAAAADIITPIVPPACPATSTAAPATTTIVRGRGAENASDHHHHINPFTVEGMKAHFTSLNSDSFLVTSSNSKKKEALSIICDQINHDQEDIQNLVPPNLFDNSNSGIVNEMKKLLFERITIQSDRQGRIGKKGIELWMKAHNSKRIFMFLNKNALLRIAAGPPFGVRMRASASYDKLINDLSEIYLNKYNNEIATAAPGAPGNPRQQQQPPVAPPLPVPPQQEVQGRQEEGARPAPAPQFNTMKQEITKALLERSFMKPLKGNSKEHCEMGQTNTCHFLSCFYSIYVTFRFAFISYYHKTNIIFKHI